MGGGGGVGGQPSVSKKKSNELLRLSTCSTDHTCIRSLSVSAEVGCSCESAGGLAGGVGIYTLCG